MTNGWTLRNDHGRAWMYFAWGGVELYRTEVWTFSSPEEAGAVLEELEAEIQSVDIVALVREAKRAKRVPRGSGSPVPIWLGRAA